LAHELSIQGSDACCDRQQIIAVDQDHGPEVVIPDEGEDQYRECCDRRAHQWQHDVPEDLQLTDALYTRRLDQLEGQCLHEVAHEQGAKAGLEGGMKKHQTCDRVVEPGLHGEVAYRHHQDLKRHEVTCHKDKKQRQSPTKAVGGQSVAG